MAATITCRTPQGRDVAVPLAALLTPALREQARVDANQWIKQLRLVPYDAVPMRQRFRYRHDSLWWFTELYLHKMRQLDTGVRTVLALEAARAEHQPTRMTVASANPAERDAALAFGRAHAVPIDLTGRPVARKDLSWASYSIGLSARLSRMRASSLPVARHPAVAAFVHTAFWKQTGDATGPQQESYVGAVLDAVSAEGREGDLYCVGVGPRRNFRTRRWWDPVATWRRDARLVTPVERLAPYASLIFF